MSAGNGSFVSADEAEADLIRLAMAETNVTFPFDVERELLKFRPYPGWEQQMRNLLARKAGNRGGPNPAGWAEKTAIRHLKQTRYLLEICDAAGIDVRKLGDLTREDVLQALRRCVPSQDGQPDLGSVTGSNGPPAGRDWGYVSLGGSLKSLRTVCAAEGIVLPAKFRELITFCSDLRHRRDVSGRVRSRAAYLRGAAALNAYGRITSASGRKHRGEYLCAGSRLLAVVADGSPRRGEMGRAERTRVHARPLANRPEKHIHIRPETSKTRKSRLLVITDEVALRFLEELQNGPGGKALLRSLTGKSLSLGQLDTMLRTATRLAVGAAASYNILRKANSAAMSTTEQRARQLGQSGTSVLADTVYHPGLAEVGRRQMAQARDEHTRRARAWVQERRKSPKPS